MPVPRPIVLLTDFGTRDAYVASMKGVIAGLFPRSHVIDLTHEIEPQNIRQAAFVLETTYPYFPPGSLFVSVVDPGVGSERRILAAKTPHGIFLAPDNGLLTRVLAREKKQELRTVNNREFFLEKVSSTFHGRDCFAPTAARLAKDPSRFSRLGPRVSSFKKIEFPEPRRKGKQVLGEVVYFDHFGNAFTNITKNAIKKGESRMAWRVRVKERLIGVVRRSYFEAPHGEAVPVFSSTDVLEIAVNQGSAREKLKLREGDRVEIF